MRILFMAAIVSIAFSSCSTSQAKPVEKPKLVTMAKLKCLRAYNANEIGTKIVMQVNPLYRQGDTIRINYRTCVIESLALMPE